MLQVVVSKLPTGVIVTAKIEMFDRDTTNIRLEGAGLPDWCEAPPIGEQFKIGLVLVGGDGLLRLVPFTPPKPPDGMYERVNRDFTNPN